MGVIATAVKHLIAAGVTGDDLVRAIEEIEEALPSGPDEGGSIVPVSTRSGAARRQAAYRARKRAAESRAEHNGDVTGDVTERNAERHQPITERNGTHNVGITGHNAERNAGITERNGRDATVTHVAPLGSPPLSPPDPQITPPYNPPTTLQLTGGRDERAKVDPFPRPDWADRQVWADFLANRKRKKLENTATAYKRLMDDIRRHADEEWPPGRLLEAATARGWGAIYPSIKDNTNGRQGFGDQRRGASISGYGATVDAAERFRARHEHHRSASGGS